MPLKVSGDFLIEGLFTTVVLGTSRSTMNDL